MIINRVDSNTLQLSADKVKVIFLLNKTKQVAEAGELLVGPGSQELNRPGEYEYNDVSIFSCEQSEKLTGFANFFKISLEGIDIGFVTGDFGKLDKHNLELIGDIDILCVTTQIKQENMQQLISDLEPVYLLPIDITDAADFEAKLGMSPAETSAKLKLKPDHFRNAEATLVPVLLSK